MPGFTGKCLCGAVSYTSHEDPIVTINCHCEDCRRSTGAVFGTNVMVPEDRVDISGELNRYTHTADSGNTMTKMFCPHAGRLSPAPAAVARTCCRSAPAASTIRKRSTRRSMCFSTGSCQRRWSMRNWPAGPGCPATPPGKNRRAGSAGDQEAAFRPLPDADASSAPR